MPNIRVLSKDLRNLIAAGEVVERPASVVKELVENSIDAGASEIEIEVKEGGLKEIVVTDDGCGMDADDLRLSIARHATSKLKTAGDLDNIMTMGFRGEALPSISGVARILIESRSRESENDAGHKMFVEGGDIKSFDEAGLPFGTKITVSDIFYNVPARKKFARAPKTELGHIKDMVQKLALANTGIRFRLKSDGRELLSAVSLNDQKQRAFEIFGEKIVAKSYSCDADAGEIRVYGLIGDPELAADGSKGIYWFVNKRPVRDKLLTHAVAEAYRSLLPRGFSPFSLLFINVASELVDVNVHPAKSEVRFLKGNAVHDFVVNVVKNALSGRVRSENITEDNIPLSLRSQACRGESSPENNYAERFSRAVERFYTSGPREQFVPSQANFAAGGKYSSLKVIGQLHNSYILCEKEGGSLVIIDQHATHERIGYEKLKEGYSRSKVESQRLLVPEVVSVPAKTVGYLEDALKDLNRLGWEIEYFGGDNFCVKAVPALIGNVNLKTVVSLLADDIAEYGKMDSVEEKIDLLMKVTACHAQVRAGDKLTISEIEHLLREMDRYDWSGRCPHGRPAVAEITLTEIGKYFNRT